MAGERRRGRRQRSRCRSTRLEPDQRQVPRQAADQRERAGRDDRLPGRRRRRRPRRTRSPATARSSTTTERTRAGRSHPKAAGAMSLHGMMAHSPDDISGFTTLTGDDNVATVVDAVQRSTSTAPSYSAVAISTNGWLEFGGNTVRRQPTRPTTACRRAAHTNPFLACVLGRHADRRHQRPLRHGRHSAEPHLHRRLPVDILTSSDDGERRHAASRCEMHEGSNAISVKYRDTSARAPTARPRRSASRARAAASATAAPARLQRQDPRRQPAERRLVGRAAAGLRQRHHRRPGRRAVRRGRSRNEPVTSCCYVDVSVRARPAPSCRVGRWRAVRSERDLHRCERPVSGRTTRPATPGSRAGSARATPAIPTSVQRDAGRRVPG